MVTSNEKGEEQLKLIDFGFASTFDFENENKLWSLGGHDPNFVAEECYSGDSPHKVMFLHSASFILK